ncbi:MAG: arginine repressor [Oscillospiraceae bacterium]|nr:arginine repressor [Oscillospiraceae bacterium]
MKNDRQEMILAIIAEEPIETQEQLIDRLKERGINSTQATISRDIKQLHLIKEPAGGGRYRYAVSAHKTRLNFADRLQTILRESILSVDYAQNLVVLKTMPGLAGAAGAAFDGMEIPQMVGSIAGDDTLMIVMRDTECAAEICAEIAAMQKKFQK